MIFRVLIKSLFTVLIGLMLLPSGLLAQQKHDGFSFPDIPGYKTLVCDFHMHTVFSDGLVWPSVRIDEAVNEGLDAISITEHIEYQNSYLAGDHNQSYDIAERRAAKKGLILIRGAEITRSMPPGHFNAIFIKDANALDTPEWKDALRIANEQGGFVFWNHPGWRQEGEIPIWYEEHSWLLQKEWIQGIEIVNENSYYPLAHQWSIDSNLTLIGNSDIHDPLDMFFDRCIGEHRPVTLVFAMERTAGAIREALDDGRTAIYYEDMLIGNEKYLEEIFLESVKVMAMNKQGGNNDLQLFIQNNASMSFELIYEDAEGVKYEAFNLRAGENHEIDSKMIDKGGKWHVKNIIVAPGKYLVVNN